MRRQACSVEDPPRRLPPSGWRAARALAGALAVSGCATSANVVPIGRDRLAVDASLGGPLTKLKETVVPAPMTAVRATYGLTDRTDVSATLHGTTLLFGLLGLEFWGKYFPVAAHGWVPSVGVAGGALLLTSVRPGAARRPALLALPLAGATAAWGLGPGHAYLGADALLDPYPFHYFPDAPRLTWEPFCGYRWQLSPDISVAGEAKKFVANWRTDEVAADLYSLDGRGTLATRHPQNGALGALLSAQWRLSP